MTKKKQENPVQEEQVPELEEQASSPETEKPDVGQRTLTAGSWDELFAEVGKIKASLKDGERLCTGCVTGGHKKYSIVVNIIQT